MRFGEHLDEEIPPAALEEFPRERCLGLDSADEALDKLPILFRRPSDGIARRAEWMSTETQRDGLGYLRRPCPEPEHGIVRPPLYDLNAVHRGIEPGEWHVEYTDAPARPAQVAPEGVASEQASVRRAVELVCSWLQLYEVV
jgi:hypothetical protein